MNFEKDLKYKNRKEKIEVFYNRYKDILVNSILDVGADECYLLNYLPKNIKYKGIGLGSDNQNLINTMYSSIDQTQSYEVLIKEPQSKKGVFKDEIPFEDYQLFLQKLKVIFCFILVLI